MEALRSNNNNTTTHERITTSDLLTPQLEVSSAAHTSTLLYDVLILDWTSPRTHPHKNTTQKTEAKTTNDLRSYAHRITYTQLTFEFFRTRQRPHVDLFWFLGARSAGAWFSVWGEGDEQRHGHRSESSRCKTLDAINYHGIGPGRSTPKRTNQAYRGTVHKTMARKKRLRFNKSESPKASPKPRSKKTVHKMLIARMRIRRFANARVNSCVGYVQKMCNTSFQKEGQW